MEYFNVYNRSTYSTDQSIQPSSNRESRLGNQPKARFSRTKVHRDRILPLYLPMYGVPAKSRTKLSRVSRAFTVSDVSLLCMLPRLVLDEVHHVTLLVYLVFAFSHERIQGRVSLFGSKNSAQLTISSIVLWFDDSSTSTKSKSFNAEIVNRRVIIHSDATLPSQQCFHLKEFLL